MRFSIPTSLLLFAGLLTAGRPARAQRLPQQVRSTLPDTGRVPRPNGARYDDRTGISALAAAVGGAVGLGAGALLAGRIAAGSRCTGEWCGVEAAVWGMAIGEVVGIGVGAHLGNGGRGNVLAPLGASAAVLLGTLVLADVVKVSEGAVFVVPLAQIVAAVVAEGRAARARAGR